MPNDSILLSPAARIAPAKLTAYLLKPLSAGDKSRFLERAGYSALDPDRLEGDIRSQLLIPAQYVEEKLHGLMYEIRGELTGPNGRKLRVRTFWMIVKQTGETRFVTLYPDKS